MACPHCGSKNLRVTRNMNESACNTCGCEYKVNENGNQVYVCGDFDVFLENVIAEVCEKINDPMIRASMKSNLKGFINEGYTSLPYYIQHLTEEADNLYNQFLSGMREKQDFGAIVEGIGQLIEWIKLHEDDYPDEEYPGLDDEEGEMSVSPEMPDVEVSACGDPEGMEEPAPEAPVIGGPGILGIGGMPAVGGLDKPTLPGSGDIALDRAQDAVEELGDALADLEDEVGNPPAAQTMGFMSESQSFSVGDKVYVGNDDSTTCTVIAIHEGTVVVKDQAGSVTKIDMNDEYREMDIQFSREETSDIVMERAEESAKMMRAKWEAFEKTLLEGDKVDSGLRHDDDTGMGFSSDEGHEEAEQKTHDMDGEVTSSVETAEDESDSPDYAGNDEDKRHGDQWGLKEEEDYDIQSDEDPKADLPDEEKPRGTISKSDAKDEVPFEEEEELDESVIGDHFHTPDGTKMPFPFTQDPTNSASEEYKEEKMEEDEEEVEENNEQIGTKGKDKLEEAALNGLRVGDIINRGSDFSTQWHVTKITRGPAKVHLKTGTKTSVMDPMRESFQYIDGVALGYERHLEGVDDTKRVWEALEESFNSEKSLQPINESDEFEMNEEGEEEVTEEKESVTKEELYRFVKEGDYHKMQRAAALQELVAKFGNQVEEMESVLDDAVLSENNEAIDETYGVQELGELDTMFALKNAWSQMEEELGVDKANQDRQNGEMGGNPRNSSKEQDVMKDLGAGSDIKINFNEGYNRGFNL